VSVFVIEVEANPIELGGVSFVDDEFRGVAFNCFDGIWDGRKSVAR
jgi:hypothetical protein